MNLDELYRIIENRREATSTNNSYTAKLLTAGIYRIAQKVGEEGVETALAGVKGDKREIVSETADLFYHILVLLAHHHITPQEVFDELKARHQEKSNENRN